MALAFNVSNLGPLSQVGFDFKDLGAVVYFAYKYSGWFNSPDRALSLEQTLASSGISLATAFTFDRDRYEVSRKQHSRTWGVARNLSNAVCRIRLPKASTATEGYPGLVSFRALVTGLLCLVDKEQIPTIIRHVPTSRIFHFEQERVDFTMEGPYLSALIRYIQSVATEEGADDYQNRILNEIDVQIQRVTCAALAELQASRHTEIGQVIGLLDWLLTPPSQGKRPVYRTRSLRVWCLAMALSEVGFDLEADHTAITTTVTEAPSELRNESYTAKERVVLILAPGWETDQGGSLGRKTLHISDVPVKPPNRAVPVRAFPAIAYTDIAPYHPQCLSAATLETAFIGTYTFFRHKLSCDEKIRLAARLPAPFKIDQRKYATLLDTAGECENVDMNNLLEELGFWSQIALKRYDFVMPLVKPIVCQYLSKMKKDQDVMLMVSCIQWAIVLATISLFIFSPDGIVDESGLDMHFMYTKPIFSVSGNRTGSLLWTCFVATVHFLGHIGFGKQRERSCANFSRLPITFNKADAQTNTISWSALVMKVVLGIDNQGLKPEPSNSDAIYWGAQRHGLVLQSDFIVNPTAEHSAAYVFHATRGHLLDMPTEKGRIVEGETTTTYLRNHNRIPFSNHEEIMEALLAEPPKYIDTLRIDLEPCWESDENKSRFVLRAGGIPKLQLGMASLFSGAHESTETDLITRVECSGESSMCIGPESILEIMLHFPQGDTWALLPLHSMIEHGQIHLPNYETKEPTTWRNNWIAKAYDSEVLLMLALNCKYPKHRNGRRKIITNCLGAGLMEHITFYGSATIILSNEKHNRLFEYRPRTCLRREDLLRTAACIIWNYVEQHMVFGREYETVELARNLIWQATSDNHTPYQSIDHLAEDILHKIVKRFQYHKEYKGITELGILAVLKALELLESRKPAQDLRPNETNFYSMSVITQRLEALVEEWQRTNMSEAELAVMADFRAVVVARAEIDVEEIVRTDGPVVEEDILSNDYNEQSEWSDDGYISEKTLVTGTAKHLLIQERQS